MDIIQQHKKFRNLSGEVSGICKRLAKLRQLGQTDSQIFEVLKSLDLPLGLHMFITGHYSDLLAYFKPR